MSMLHQETWVRFGTNGIGLSDHQNRYSNGIRIANWVENEFGDHLTKTASERTMPFPLSTVQSDFRGTPLDDEGSKPCLAATMTSASLPHGPDGIENLRLLTSTYDLTMSHAEGPRRVDTLLWSGITKVDTKIPTTILEKGSLLDKKKAEWSAQRESPWRTAYDQQFTRSEAAAAAAAASLREPRRAVPRRPGDSNFSADPRPHVAMALREYG